MFKDKYKQEMDKINIDETVRERVLEGITRQDNKKTFAKTAFVRSTIALAAVAAIVCSLWVTDIIGNKKPVKVNVNSTQSYEAIYNTVKKFKSQGSDGIFSYLTDFGNIKVTDDVLENFNGAAMPEGSNDTNTSAGGTANSNSNTSHSETTTQVEGVDEADIIKTDGKNIYSLSTSKKEIRIISAGKEPLLLSKISTDAQELFLYGDYIVAMGNIFEPDRQTFAVIYSVADPKNPEKLYECRQSGYFNTARLIGDKLYIISNHSINPDRIKKSRPQSYVPTVECEGTSGAVLPETVTTLEECNSPSYTVLCGYDITNGKLVGTQSVLGYTNTVYCSLNNIIIAGQYKDNKTALHRYEIKGGEITHKAEGEINGYLLNQFSLDEYKGYFRFVVTTTQGVEIKEDNFVSYKVDNANALYVLDDNLKQVGSIENIAPNERVYSVRFMGDTAYFVTFRQVDPLFSVDLSNPKSPKIIGKLKIPGFSNYLFPYGEGKLLGFGQEANSNGITLGLKLSLFDISNPSNVTENNKMVMENYYSEAFYNHKAIIVDYSKNIITFPVYGDEGTEYNVFTLSNEGFKRLGVVKTNSSDSQVRGIYIDNLFYVVGTKTALVYSMENFSQISKLDF